MSIRKTSRISAPVAAAAGLVLVLAACGGGGGDTPDAQGDGETSTHKPGPLEAMWGDAFGEFDEDEANAQQNRMEQIVAECMVAEGWEYTPVDYSQMGGAISMPIEGDDSDGPQWGTEEYAKELGYGITTWEDEGMESAPPEGEESEWTDPNQEYVEALSDTARDAYYEALNGPQPTEEEMNSGEWEYDPANAGCYGEASEEVFNPGGDVFQDEKFKALIDEMNLIYTSMENDPKVAAAKSQWSSCMTDAGYPGLADPSAAQDVIYTEMSQYWENGEEPDEATMTAIREKERAIATADFTCAKTSNINDVQIEVQHQVEQDFVDANRAELEELVAAFKEQQEAAKG